MPRQAAAILVAAVSEIAWGLAAVTALYMPLYIIQGPPVDAWLALTWSRVLFLGVPFEPGPASHIHAGMLVASVGAIMVLLLGGVALYYTAAGAPGVALVASTTAAMIALVTVGPMEGAAEALRRIAGELASYTSYTTNAGTIILGRSRLVEGAAATLLSRGPLSPLSLLAYLAAAAVLVAHYLASSRETRSHSR